MNVLIVILLVVAVILLAVIAFRGPRERELDPDTRARFEAGLRSQDRPWPQPLNAQIERTQMMGETLKKDASKMRINDPLPMRSDDGRLHDRKHKKAQFYIPENLTEEEKATLKEFYNL